MKPLLVHILSDTSARGNNRAIISINGERVLVNTPEYYEDDDYDNATEYRNDGFFVDPQIFPTYEEFNVMFKGRTEILADVLTGRVIRDQIMHFDPEFETWTYGVSPKMNGFIHSIIKNMNPENNPDKRVEIFFGSSMRLFEDEVSEKWAKFIVGFLVVDKIYYRGFKDIIPENDDRFIEILPNEDFPRISNNFHYKCRDHEYKEDNLFIIAGDLLQSRLFPIPIRLTSWNPSQTDKIKDYYVTPFSNFENGNFSRGFMNMDIRSRNYLLQFISELEDESHLYLHPDFNKGHFEFNFDAL